MTARANTSSGPKAGLEPTGSHDARHPVAYAIVSGIAIALLLLVIGLLSDTHDTYFNVIGPASLAGGAIVAFFIWRCQTSFVRPHRPRVHSFENSYEHIVELGHRATRQIQRANDEPHANDVLPFGRSGGGHFTGHPIGLVIVVSVLLMGIVGIPEARLFFLGSIVLGSLLGFALWLRHR